MKLLIIFFFVFSAFQTSAQQSSPINLRENFLNNYQYSRGGEKITKDQIFAAMAEYPETLKKFQVGQRNMAIGSGMKVATVLLMTSGMVYFIADDFSESSRNFFLITGISGMVMGFVAPGIRDEGKRNVSEAIEEFNFQNYRKQNVPLTQNSFYLGNHYAIGWKFRF